MNTVQRVISAGFATAALAAATVPALANSVWLDIDLDASPPAASRWAMHGGSPAADGYVRDVALRIDPRAGSARSTLHPILLHR